VTKVEQAAVSAVALLANDLGRDGIQVCSAKLLNNGDEIVIKYKYDNDGDDLIL
jgi:hypothetical protein